MATENSRNMYDKKDSLELGFSSENEFEKVAKKRGWKVTPASKTDNIKNHIDYIIEKDSFKFFVDVKGLKRVSRGDSDVQDKTIWIELKNVASNNGWLYGKANIIAFETFTSFLIVRRLDLVALIDKIVDKTKRATSAKDALYKLYTRYGRNDEITMIKTSDLEEITRAEWLK